MKLDNNKLIIIILVLAILILIKKNKNVNINTNTNNKEAFRVFYESSPSTRNMSYDLRCEPIIPKNHYGIRNSSIEPHYRRKCLDIVSR